MPDDAARPRLHFTARSGWINDPLGLTHHDGRFHLFYQYAPDQSEWVTEQCWGHATSEDLLHWTEGAVALAPGDGDDGVWSGCVVAPADGPAALFYTTIERATSRIGRVRLARPDDEAWTAWTKHDVVAELPPGVDAVELRDPFVLHDGTCWRMLLGAGLADGTAAALTYVSANLASWRYDGVLASRPGAADDPVRTGVMWECPQLVRVGDRWVLVVSVSDGGADRFAACAVGELVAGRFVADSWQRLSYGPSPYAASAFTDGAPGLIYWLIGVADPDGRWTGAHSVPHLLALEGGRVVARPHPAVAGARRGVPVVRRDDAAPLPPTADVEWTLDRGPATGTARLAVADGTGREQVRLEHRAGTLTVHVGDEAWQLPVGGQRARVLADGPVLEVFGDAGTFAAPIRGAGQPRTLTASGPAEARVHGLG